RSLTNVPGHLPRAFDLLTVPADDDIVLLKPSLGSAATGDYAIDERAPLLTQFESLDGFTPHLSKLNAQEAVGRQLDPACWFGWLDPSCSCWFGCLLIAIGTDAGHRYGTTSKQRGRAEYQARFHGLFLLPRNGTRANKD